MSSPSEFGSPAKQSPEAVSHPIAAHNDSKQLLYKTELCKKFTEVGYCGYGSKCQFAHGIQEMRYVQKHPKYKTEPCKSFWSTGSCRYGSRCKFKHDESQEELARRLGAPAPATSMGLASAPVGPTASLPMRVSMPVLLPMPMVSPMSPYDELSLDGSTPYSSNSDDYYSTYSYSEGAPYYYSSMPGNYAPVPFSMPRRFSLEQSRLSSVPLPLPMPPFSDSRKHTWPTLGGVPSGPSASMPGSQGLSGSQDVPPYPLPPHTFQPTFLLPVNGLNGLPPSSGHSSASFLPTALTAIPKVAREPVRSLCLQSDSSASLCVPLEKSSSASARAASDPYSMPDGQRLPIFQKLLSVQTPSAPPPLQS